MSLAGYDRTRSSDTELLPSRRQSSEMLSSPRRPSSTMRIFSSEEYLRRVLRLISRITLSGSVRFGMAHSLRGMMIP